MLTIDFSESDLTTSDGSAYNDSNSTEMMPSGEPPELEIRWGMLSLSIFIVATAAGNVLVCLAVTWEKRLQNMANYFLMSLAIADLLVSLLVMPLAMIVELYGYFPLSQSFCVIWATSDVLLCTASIWHMCTMSMDRYFTIRYPIKYGRNKTKKMMTLKITFVWVISFSVSAPLAIAGFIDHSNVYTSGKCVISLKNFILYGSIFAFYVPLIIMVTTYTLTIRILKNNRVITSTLDGKYPSIRSDSVHRPEQNGTSKITETTRLNCTVGQSPPHSGYTITSAGLTSARGSSGESPRSPEAKIFGFSNARVPNHPLEMLKLADETNYLSYTFDQMFMDSQGCKPKTGYNNRLHSSSQTFRLRSDSRISRSSSQPSMADLYGRTQLSLHIRRRSSEMNLRKGQAFECPSTLSTCHQSPDRKRNLANNFGCDHSVDESCAPSHSHRSFSPKPIVFQVTPVPVDSLIVGHDAEFQKSLMCLELEKVLNKKSCITTQTTDKSSDPLRSFGTAPSVIGSPYGEDSIDKDRILAITHQTSEDVANLVASGGLQKPNEDKSNEENFDRLSMRLNSNDSQKEFTDIICRAEEEETRGLLLKPTSELSRKRCPAPWSTVRSSIDNTAKSENRTFLKTRVQPRRSKQPRACARKIGLQAKSRSSNERKASKVLGIIFAVFVLAWTPFFMLNIISVLCESCMESVSESMSASIVWLGYLSSLANPIIYTMFSTSFRTVFYRILTCQYQTSSCCIYAQRRSPNGRVLCWSKSGKKNSCRRDFGCNFHGCGV